MKKLKLKSIIAVFLTFVMCFAMSIPTFAIGIGGYRNYYHNGNSWKGSYTISTNSITLPMKQITVERSGFNSDTSIVIGVFNSNGVRVMDDMWFTGNGKQENISMTVPGAFINGGTYTIKYNIYHGGTTPLAGDDGWIGIWIY